MNPRLAGALELERRILARGAQEVVPLPLGCALRHRGLSAVHELNAVRLRAPLPPAIDADAVERLADRWLDGLAHRQVVLDDAAAGERLTDPLTERGWERRRTLFMALGEEAVPAPPFARDPRAREIDEDELQALQLAVFGEEDYGPYAAPGLVAQLVEAQAALRAGTDARRFGAGQEDRLASMCTLYLDPDVAGRRIAMVEQVATLRLHREQGLAKATASAALRAAAAWGADHVVVPTDADDWPQLLYAGLGFTPIGLQISFTLRAATGTDARSGRATTSPPRA